VSGIAAELRVEKRERAEGEASLFLLLLLAFFMVTSYIATIMRQLRRSVHLSNSVEHITQSLT